MTTLQTPDAATLATQKQALPKHGLTLIGLFGTTDDLQALVRMPGGRIKRIKTGARLPIGRVVAIDVDGMVVAHGNNTVRLSVLDQK